MNIPTLRTVLLIQAIEESDRAGDVLAPADREEATRTAIRALPPSRTLEPRIPLSKDAQSFLAARADILLDRVRLRSPAVDQVLAVAGGLTWLGRVVLGLALIAGVSMSALDGSRRIDILNFPLLGLIAWNLLIYALLICGRLRPARARGPQTSRALWSGALYERWIGRRIDSLLRQSKRFNAPLASGLRRFCSEWAHTVHPLLIVRATRLMHFAAALLAVGLVAGLYLRGIALRYEAGWESTFLGPGSVHVVLVLLYGPAAAISGIPLPSSDGIGALRWTGTGGGAEAATWIHLIAVTAAVYIVVPRVILACLCGFKLWRLSRQAPLPASALGYARALLVGAVGGASVESVNVTAFAYEPDPDSLAGLQVLLAGIVGAAVKVVLRAPIPYGEEENGLRAWRESSSVSQGWTVLLMALASTPEAENHGALIRGLRDFPGNTAPLLIVVDAGPYAARMQGDASFSQRLQERRKLWSDFIGGYGMQACVVDLAQILAGSPAEIEAREAARAALWSADARA